MFNSLYHMPLNLLKRSYSIIWRKKRHGIAIFTRRKIHAIYKITSDTNYTVLISSLNES